MPFAPPGCPAPAASPCEGVEAARQALGQIPKEDAARLDVMFRRLVYHQGLGHGLLAEKPVTLAALAREAEAAPGEDPMVWRTDVPPPLDDWFIWERCRHLFPVHGRTLRLDPHGPRPDSQGLLLINHAAVLDTVESNLRLFRQRLREDVAPADLLWRLTSGGGLGAAARGDALLEGLLFGYGPVNAELFQRLEEFRRASAGREISFAEEERPEPGYALPRADAGALSFQFSPVRVPSRAFGGFEARECGPVGLYLLPDAPETPALVESIAAAHRRLEAMLPSSDFLPWFLTMLCSAPRRQ